MFEQLRARLRRPTLLLATGIAIGALLAPASGGGAKAVTEITYTRAVSCPGLAWQPQHSSITYAAEGALRFSYSEGFFFCNADLPHKAVVTRVRFTLRDLSTHGGLVNCALVREGITSTTAGNLSVMASVGLTSDVGLQRKADSTISYATVDNNNNVYFLQCQFEGESLGSLVGIYGADIQFTITDANG